MAERIIPGPLKKTLRGNPIFALFSTPTGSVYDDDIYSVVIHRGKSRRGGGVHPSTMEIKTRGLHPAALSGNNVRFFMRDEPAALLAAKLNATGPEIAFRFQGRAGKLSVDDNAGEFDTTIYAASWISRSNLSGRGTYPLNGQRLNLILSNVLALADDPRGLDVSFLGTFDQIAGDQDPIDFANASKRYGSDVGIYFKELRDGRTQVMTLPYRKTQADALAVTQIPLTRSQALSPAGWEQANEFPAINLEYTVTNSDGNIVTRSYEIDSGDPINEKVTEDWSYIRSTSGGADGQTYMEAYGRIYESSARIYSLPTLTIDLLYLINSPHQYHRDQAGQLLKMEPGDPIYFSGDWPSQVRGVHFAEGITETITGNEWKLELSLVPYSYALGMPIQPTITPRIWDSASNVWDAETKTWNQH